MRLNAIAQVLAQTIAARISAKVRQPGHPWLLRAATAIAANAKGSAKTVCENFTKEPQRLSKETISEPLPIIPARRTTVEPGGSARRCGRALAPQLYRPPALPFVDACRRRGWPAGWSPLPGAKARSS